MNENKKDVKPVAKGHAAKPTAKGKARRFMHDLLSEGEESKLDIKNTIIIPAVENALFDTVSAITGAVTDAFEAAIFKGGSSKYRKRRRKGGIVDYNEPYRKSSSGIITFLSGGSEDRDGGRQMSKRAKELHDFSEIIFDTMTEARDVLDALDALIDEYGAATLADFYRAADVSSVNYQDQKWGWTSLNGAYPTHTRDGYILVLPKPVYLKWYEG